MKHGDGGHHEEDGVHRAASAVVERGEIVEEANDGGAIEEWDRFEVIAAQKIL